MIKRIYVGSESQIKLEAVREVFGENILIKGYSAESGVRDQPIGREETKKGAINRAMKAMEFANDDSLEAWSIGIENGMWNDKTDNKGEVKDGGWEDAACIIAFQHHTSEPMREIELWSESLDIPKILPFEGGPNGEWSTWKDPHSILTKGKKTRKDFLIVPLKQLKKKMSSS